MYSIYLVLYVVQCQLRIAVLPVVVIKFFTVNQTHKMTAVITDLRERGTKRDQQHEHYVSSG
jgi:hypothetical protein